ncbi:MAG: ABC transporter ATP-binding protein [Chitinivibrionales bacterium]|nr:ABC transporter ATP-binding protein [Chitinivibrionales bacterium]
MKIRKKTKKPASPTTAEAETPFWATLLSFVKPYRGTFALASCMAVLAGTAVALQPLIIKWIVDDGILRKLHDGSHAPAGQCLKYVAFFTGLFLLSSVLRIVFWMIGYRRLIAVIEQLLCDLRSQFFRHAQHLSFRFHDRVSSGELFNYIMGSPLTALKTFLHQGALWIPSQIVTWIVAVIMLLRFNAAMTLISLAMAAAVVYVNNRSRFIIRELTSDFMETESSVSKYVADMLQGSRAIKMYAIEDSISGSFESYVDRIRVQGVRLAYRQQLEGIKPEFLQYVGMALIYGTGAYFCLYREMQIGTFFAFISSVQLLMGPLMSLLQLNLVRANAEAGLNRIMRIMHSEQGIADPPAISRVNVAPQAAHARAAKIPCVEFVNVCFSYDKKPALFKDMSCRIEDGQSIALVGPSGSGKSTFAMLLMRLYDPQTGRILLNGIELNRYGLQELRASFGVVPQAPFIFQGTILNNIKVVKPLASDAEVKRAMEIAFVTEFLRDLPDGEQTYIGESGFNLSGGQRQRIAIARAVLSAPRYYLFDEATSALDNQSERRIQAAMDELMKGHTTFVIAHRLSTVRHVDRILVFEHGRIVQDGNYAQLTQQEGTFQTLLNSAL